MSILNPTRAVTKFEREELAAQRMACSLLVRGGESALFRFGLGANTAVAKETQVERRAVEIAREILASWRATLDIVRKLEGKHRWPDVGTLEGWLHVDPALSDNALASSRTWFDSQR